MFNNFVELDLERLDAHDVAAYLSVDLLSLEARRYRGEAEAGAPADFVLDLGWYPGGDPDGEYRLRLLRSGWDDIVASFSHRNQDKMQSAIERSLELAYAREGTIDLNLELRQATE